MNKMPTHEEKLALINEDDLCDVSMFALKAFRESQRNGPGESLENHEKHQWTILGTCVDGMCDVPEDQSGPAQRDALVVKQYIRDLDHLTFSIDELFKQHLLESKDVRDYFLHWNLYVAPKLNSVKA